MIHTHTTWPWAFIKDVPILTTRKFSKIGYVLFNSFNLVKTLSLNHKIIRENNAVQWII